MSVVAQAQTPTVDPRVISAQNPFAVGGVTSDDLPVWETWLAVTPRRVMSVFHNQYWFEGAIRFGIGYAVYDRMADPPAWVGTGFIPNGEYKAVGDPSIAASTFSGNFVAMAYGSLASDGGGGPGEPDVPYLLSAQYNAAVGSWEPWMLVATADSGNRIDKDWVVAGEVNLQRAEYYGTFYGSSLFRVGRSWGTSSPGPLGFFAFGQPAGRGPRSAQRHS